MSTVDTYKHTTTSTHCTKITTPHQHFTTKIQPKYHTSYSKNSPKNYSPTLRQHITPTYHTLTTHHLALTDSQNITIKVSISNNAQITIEITKNNPFIKSKFRKNYRKVIIILKVLYQILLYKFNTTNNN